MPYRFTWLEPHQIALVEVYGEFHSEHLEDWMRLIIDSMDTHPYTYYAVIQIQPGSMFTVNPLTTPSLFDAVRHPHFGMLVFVGVTSLTAFWIEQVRTLTGLRFRVEHTLGEAQRLIYEAWKLDCKK